MYEITWDKVVNVVSATLAFRSQVGEQEDTRATEWPERSEEGRKPKKKKEYPSPKKTSSCHNKNILSEVIFSSHIMCLMTKN